MLFGMRHEIVSHAIWANHCLARDVGDFQAAGDAVELVGWIFVCSGDLAGAV
jgi:hypothetical protein